MKTSKQYIDGLAKMKPNVYMDGKIVDRATDVFIAKGVNVIAKTFDMALDPEYEDLLTATSHITGRKINRLANIHRTTDDMVKKVKATRLLCQQVGGCIQRCMGADQLNALSNVSYTMDKELGTSYHGRFLDYLRHFQDNDLLLSTCMTDLKGDRRLRPAQQPDPDLYLRVVERRKDGIIVRGAKAHTGNGAYADEHFVLPTRAFREDEADYAVAFAIPADTDGIIMVNHSAATPHVKELEAPWSSTFNVTHSTTIFDNVFVPWERVFLCGEWRYAGMLTGQFATYHRQSYCGCKPATTDILMGAAALAAEYNGTSQIGHIRSKLAEMITIAEMVFASGLASAYGAKQMPSGTFFPDVTFCNAGKYYSGTTLHHEYELLQDIAGGLCATIPGEDDYRHPVLGQFLRKYLKGAVEVPVDDRVKCFYLIEDLTVSKTAGFWAAAAVHGGGSPEMERKAILADYDLEAKKALAKRLARIT